MSKKILIVDDIDDSWEHVSTLKVGDSVRDALEQYLTVDKAIMESAAAQLVRGMRDQSSSINDFIIPTFQRKESLGTDLGKLIKDSELKFELDESKPPPQRSLLGRVFDCVPMSSQTREDLSYILDDVDEDVEEMKAKGTGSFTVKVVAGGRLVSSLATLFWGALKGIFNRPLPSQSRDKSRSDE